MASSTLSKEFKLDWGDPLIVRQALIETLGYDIPLIKQSLSDMGYPQHLGSPKLIELLKELAFRQSGHKPKHLMVTCGCTGAIHAALHSLKGKYVDWVVTDDRYYPIYSSIISVTTDMIMINRDRKANYLKEGLVEKNFISLIASPSAPDGFIYPFESVDIWDASYASRTYGIGPQQPAKWKIMCGSLSKTLGLSGLRLGWVSTDDDHLAESLSDYVTASYIGLSSASQSIAEEVLYDLGLSRFEKRSAAYLDSNREEAQKLLNRFGQGSVPTRGMFCTLELGKIERKALERANIKWLSGSAWGEDDSWARLSLGQTREIVRSAVKAALK